jgi:hypothetical protein
MKSDTQKTFVMFVLNKKNATGMVAFGLINRVAYPRVFSERRGQGC